MHSGGRAPGQFFWSRSSHSLILQEVLPLRFQESGWGLIAYPDGPDLVMVGRMLGPHGEPGSDSRL